MDELINEIIHTATYNRLITIFTHYWYIVLLAIVVVGLTAKNDDGFIPLGRIKGIVKKGDNE
jgi:predicted secreted protein